MIRILTLALLVLCNFSYAQNDHNMFAFEEMVDIVVIEGSDSVRNAWAGGINYGEVNTMDLNGDNKDDLVLFDKGGSRITTYINTGTSGNAIYTYDPAYRKNFPHVENWMIMRDFNCDGNKDIFAGYHHGIKVYENTGTGGAPSFQLAHASEYLQGIYGGNQINLFVPITDIPAIEDVDNDGDLDFLTFGPQTNYVQWIDNNQSCGLEFYLKENCWGQFLESAFNNEVYLNTCPPFKKKTMHSGGALLAIDLDGDDVTELLLSDISFNTLLALYNNGTEDSAFMNSQDTLFPNYNVPVDMQHFPAAFYEDVTGDGKKDLIVSPFEGYTGAITHNSMWLYKNNGTTSTPLFEKIKEDFLQESQIDLGEVVIPRLVDLNNDSLMDLVLANGGYLMSPANYKQAFRYYQNTGTVTKPEFTLIDSNLADISSYGLGMAPVPAFGDLDKDGDQDMIVGDENGKLHLFINNGNVGTPAFTINTGAGFQNIDVGSSAAPYLFDLDKDGDLDMLVGNKRGKVSYFTNNSETTPNFTFENDYFGGIDVLGPYSSSGYSVPYIFEKDSIINIFVGSESGIHHYDSVNTVVGLPYQITKTFGNDTQVSANHNETPLGISKRSGRNQILIRAEELKAEGMVAGYITGLAFDVTTSGNPDVQWIDMRMKNVTFDDLNHFEETDLDSVFENRRDGFAAGWSRLNFDYPFLWDGKSNLLIEICFDGFIPNNNIHVNMSTTNYNSYAWGDITNFNQLNVNGCQMPFLASSNKRPNIKLDLTPALAHTNVMLRDGYRNAAAIHDLNNDGFPDAILGNFAGGVGYYEGEFYNISIPEPKTYDLSDLTIYPNPGDGEYTVITENMGEGEIKVYDLMGKFIKSVPITESTTKVELNSQAAGIYLFVLQSEGGIRTQKVILE